MDISIFYSWQSDRPEDFCHYFIRDAANQALKDIGASNEVELLPRLDHDTKGQAGMPEIADTILRKIQGAGFFLADMTFIAATIVGKEFQTQTYCWSLASPHVPLDGNG